jgi:acyl-CoA reductase-like NAD-dependent aldehyde dehydrogenase
MFSRVAEYPAATRTVLLNMSKVSETDCLRMLAAADLARIMPFIDGRPSDSASNSLLTVYNPCSGQKLYDIPAGCSEDVGRALRSSVANLRTGAWRKAPPSARKRILYKWADLIERNASRLDALDAIEMGKPVSLPVFNALGAAGLLRFNAEAIDKSSGEVLTSDSSSTVIQTRVPRGVVAAIVPWNFPTYNAILKVAPALAAGNSVVLKPSELASQAALCLASLAVEAGLPPGSLNVVPGRGEIVGRALGEHPQVDMITFTGSSAVGKLMLQYSANSNMKLVSAECGGKSPQIVFDDGVDIDAVATSIAATLCLNQGQVCSVGSRLLVQDSLEEVLVQKVIARFRDIVVGNPQLRETTYGPLASESQLAKVSGYIEAGKADGADLVYGGSRLLEGTGGYFVEPTVFVNVPEDSSIAQEEIFGPVLSVMRFRDVDDAIRLASGTGYGLAAYVWTSRLASGFKLANELQTALTMVSVAPIGGEGEGPGYAFSGEPHGLSGIGVEGGVAGLEAYMRRQTTWFNHG